MAISVSANWKEAVLRSGAEIRLLMSIYDDGGLRAIASDGSTATTPLSGENIASAIVGVSQIASEIDPKTRLTEIGRVTIEVLDKWVRPYVVNYRMKGMKVILKLGARELALSDYETYFTGFIDDIIPQPDGLTVLIECLDTWSMIKDQEIVGSWVGLHPLEAIEDIYDTKMGLDSSLWDDTSLDPSDSANAANSHLLVSRTAVPHAPWLKDMTVDEPSSAEKLVKGLLEIVDGVQIPNAAGELAVRIFDPSESAVAHWDEDEINEFEQLEDMVNLTNKVSVRCATDKWYTQNDTDSQSNHAHGNVTAFIEGEGIDNKWVQQAALNCTASGVISPGSNQIEFDPQADAVSGHRDSYPWSSQPADARPYSHLKNQDETYYDNSPSTEGSFFGGFAYVATEVITLTDGSTVTVDAVDGLGTVTQFTIDNSAGDGTTAAGFDVLQSSTTGAGFGFQLSVDVDNVIETRPLYFQMYHPMVPYKEIIKVTTQPTGGNKRIQNYYDPSTDTVKGTSYSAYNTYRVQRAQLGSSAYAFPRYSLLVDITAQVFMADHILNRYGGDSSPKIRVRTSLKQFAVEVGDLVTIDRPQFLAYGVDGIDNTTKWQALSKSVDIGAAEPSIEWTLLRAVEGTSTRTHNTYRNQMTSNADESHNAKSLLGNGLGKVRVMSIPGWSGNGISVELVSGFNVKLNPGLLADLTRAIRAHEVASETLSASKDIYIYVDSVRGDWVIKEVTLGAARPDEEVTDVPVAKVVTDGSGVTSITDLTAESVSTSGSDIVSWENTFTDDVPNGSFGDW